MADTKISGLTDGSPLVATDELVINRGGVNYRVFPAAVAGSGSASALTGTTLASGVVTSSLTTVGTVGTGTWQATAIGASFVSTLNQNTTGSAASLSISGQTGLMTVTGLVSTNRIKTVRDAADTLLELGGSYTPTGTWTNLTMVTPTLGTPASGNLANCTLPANAQKRSISVTFDGGGTALTAGKISYLATVPYAGTITAWDIVADQSGSAVIDVWKANAAVPTVANTITASALPTISSAQSAFAGAITAWTTAVSAGDVFGFKLNSATTVTSVTLTILITAT